MSEHATTEVHYSIKKTGHILCCNNNHLIYCERAMCSGVVTVDSMVSEVSKVGVVKVVYRTLFKLAMLNQMLLNI